MQNIEGFCRAGRTKIVDARISECDYCSMVQFFWHIDQWAYNLYYIKWEKSFAVFVRFSMSNKSFPDKYLIEQWLSLALSIQMKQKLQKFSLHSDEIQWTAKLLSCFTFVIYTIGKFK